jgi:hypothetical protein
MDAIEAQNADAFFASAPPLKDREAIVARVEEFIRRRLPTDVRGWCLAYLHSQVKYSFCAICSSKHIGGNLCPKMFHSMCR